MTTTIGRPYEPYHSLLAAAIDDIKDGLSRAQYEAADDAARQVYADESWEDDERGFLEAMKAIRRAALGEGRR